MEAKSLLLPDWNELVSGSPRLKDSVCDRGGEEERYPQYCAGEAEGYATCGRCDTGSGKQRVARDVPKADRVTPTRAEASANQLGTPAGEVDRHGKPECGEQERDCAAADPGGRESSHPSRNLGKRKDLTEHTRRWRRDDLVRGDLAAESKAGAQHAGPSWQKPQR